jgi:CxxC-x17-CxxC domain-containing protein
MGNFNKFSKGPRGGKGFAGGKSFGGGQRFGGHGDGPRQMFPAVCDKCGQSCEVPFKPSGDRPVLCNNCFKGSSDRGNKFAPKSFGRDNRDNSFNRAPAPAQAGGISKAQFDALSAKVDRILAILSEAEIEPAMAEEVIFEKPKAKKAPVKKTVEKKEKKPAKKAKAKKK